MFTLRNSKNIITRNYWNIGKGKSIGFIECIYKSGYLIQTDYVSFRETSSNMATGEVIEFSTAKLSPEGKKTLDDVLSKRIPVMIDRSLDLFGSPLSGDIYLPRYIHNVKVLRDEKINVDITPF